MKVLFCANDSAGVTVGGPDIWVRRLPLYLKQKGIDVELCFFYLGDLSHCRTIAYVKSQGIIVNSISNNKNRFTEQRVAEFLKLVELMQPDIVIANLCVPAMFSIKYLNKAEIPLIPVLHANNEFYLGIIEEFVNRKGPFRVKHIVGVSDYLTSKCKTAKGIYATAISCGTTVPGFKINSPDDYLNIVYIGRFRQWQKRIFDVTTSFCIAAQVIPNTQYFFYGYGPDGEEETMQNIIKDYNLEDRVIIKGLLDNDQLKRDLIDKHIVVLMSDYEGLPMALIEAMALGLVPVCLSEKSGVNELIEDAENGILIHNRNEEFTKAIKFLQDNPKEWSKMSEKAIKTVINRYSNEVEDEKWLNLLLEIHQTSSTLKTKFVAPKRIRLPKKNEKIIEDVREVNKLSWLGRLRMSIGIRTRAKRIFTFIRN